MVDYPLIPPVPESARHFVHRAYIEALWLPEVSVNHFISNFILLVISNMAEFMFTTSLLFRCRIWSIRFDV